METVFKVPARDNPDVAAYANQLRERHGCPIAVCVEQECNSGETVNYFVTLTKEELEQIEQGDKVVILRDVKIEVEVS